MLGLSSVDATNDGVSGHGKYLQSLEGSCLTNSPSGHSFSDFVHDFGVSVVDNAVGSVVDAGTGIVAAVEVVVVTGDGR